jgi:methylthioribose-1-phosphate isomerase
MRSIEWVGDKVKIIDQTKLPMKVEFIETDDYKVVAEAIKSLKVRGAPAIGIAAGFGIYLGIKFYDENDKDKFKLTFEKICDDLLNETDSC